MWVLTSIRALVGLLLLAGLCIPAHAQRWSPDSAGARSYAPRAVAERRVSLAQAVEMVQRATGGKVLDARDLGGQYRIKVLTRSGEVRVVYVDAQTGAMRD
jgi:uncharacterized membrane protein YkoI